MGNYIPGRVQPQDQPQEQAQEPQQQQAVEEEERPQPQPARSPASFLSESSRLLWGPHFVVTNSLAGGGGTLAPQATGVGWSDIQNEVLASALAKHTPQHPPPTNRIPATTLQALVNLKKNTLRLHKTTSSCYSLEFKYDTATNCYIRIYWLAKQVLLEEPSFDGQAPKNKIQAYVLRTGSFPLLIVPKSLFWDYPSSPSILIVSPYYSLLIISF